jgi:hypothetical protein
MDESFENDVLITSNRKVLLFSVPSKNSKDSLNFSSNVNLGN